jgi:hypothetical protein
LNRISDNILPCITPHLVSNHPVMPMFVLTQFVVISCLFYSVYYFW